MKWFLFATILFRVIISSARRTINKGGQEYPTGKRPRSETWWSAMNYRLLAAAVCGSPNQGCFIRKHNDLVKHTTSRFQGLSIPVAMTILIRNTFSKE